MSLVFLIFSSDSATILCVNENRLTYVITIITIILMIDDGGVQLELSEDGWRDFPLLLACIGDCRLLSKDYPLLGVVITFGNGQLL